MPPELGSSNAALESRSDSPESVPYSNGMVKEQGTPGQLKNGTVDFSDGDSFPVEAFYSAPNGSLLSEIGEKHIADTDTDLDASASQLTDSIVNSEMEEATDASGSCNGNELTDILPVEGTHGLESDGNSAAADASAWTTDGQLGAEGDGSGWISAEGGVPGAAPASLPEQGLPLPRRRTFCLVRIPRFVDNKLRNEIRLAELQFKEKSKKRDFLRAALQLKRASKTELLEKLRPAQKRERACREAIQGKRTEMEPVQDSLKKFRSAYSTGREKGPDLCSSEEELNERIAFIQHRIQHESIPLKEEKQLIREIKQLEASRRQVYANMVMQAELVENLGPREDVQERCRLLGLELDVLRKEHKQARADYEVFEKEVETLNVAIEDLRQQVDKANVAQQEAYITFKALRRQESVQNDEFYRNKRDIQYAKQLTLEKDFEGLDKVCQEQVERILSLWNNDAKFRAAYVRNNERSTLKRLETLDGRSLGPEEEPPLLSSDIEILTDPLHKSHESNAAAALLVAASGGGRTKNSKVPIKEAKLPAEVLVATFHENTMETEILLDSKKSQKKNAEIVNSSKPLIPIATISNLSSTPLTDTLEDIAKKEAEAAELKEKCRQEEMSKAMEAAERKRKQAERVQVKLQIRAQKEAERKQKEKEKKARKKAAASASTAGEMDVNLADVAFESETQEAVSESKEHDSLGSPKETPQVSKGSTVPRRRPMGKKLRTSKAASLNPLTKKKGISSLPVWFWFVLVVVLLLVLVLGLMLRS